MAEIVAGIGVPHAPNFPALVAKQGADSEVARLYREIAEQLDAVRPDVLVLFSNDHFNTFFLNNWPTLAIGVADATSGPNDQTPMPQYKLPVHGGLAGHIRRRAVEAGFDLTLSEEFELDHAFMVPLHFLTPEMKIPVVPIFVNGFVAPLPSAQRCLALGEAVRAAIKSFPANLRVAAMGTGSFSLEIGGPRIPAGQRSGVPDAAWSDRVLDHLAHGRLAELVKESTAEQMWRAGNAGGEVLNWIAMLGVVGGGKPVHLRPQQGEGHAFGFWRGE
jgi:protocatechuate 4,5-dioxygenase beta chain